MKNKPELKLEESRGFYHLFVNGLHEPSWCAECVVGGLWPVELASQTPTTTLKADDSKGK